jgi:hypothetical protein
MAEINNEIGFQSDFDEFGEEIGNIPDLTENEYDENLMNTLQQSNIDHIEQKVFTPLSSKSESESRSRSKNRSKRKSKSKRSYKRSYKKRSSTPKSSNDSTNDSDTEHENEDGSITKNIGTNFNKIRNIIKNTALFYIFVLFMATFAGGSIVSLYGNVCGLSIFSPTSWLSTFFLMSSPVCKTLNWVSYLSTQIIENIFFHSVIAGITFCTSFLPQQLHTQTYTQPSTPVGSRDMR